MRLWGQIYKDGQKQSEYLIHMEINKRTELRKNEEMLIEALAALSHDMDLERPVIVKKHLRDLYEFGRTVFLPSDFMDSTDFDRFVVEAIADAQ